MPRTDPVLLFDLDGTILRRNSFPLWVMSMLTGGDPQAGLRRRAALSLRAQDLLIQRKLGRLSHDRFLRDLQSLWADIGDGTTAARLQAKLLKLVRPNLAPAMKLLGEPQTDALLATAAAAEYAEPLGRALGFHYVLATSRGPGRDAPCNSGEVKRERVLEFLKQQGWAHRPRIFFNDHMDDLPLMELCQAVCWFGSTRELRAARAAAPNARFVPCRGLRPDEMHQLIAHLRQSVEAAQLANTVSASWSRAMTAP